LSATASQGQAGPRYWASVCAGYTGRRDPPRELFRRVRPGGDAI